MEYVLIFITRCINAKIVKFQAEGGRARPVLILMRFKFGTWLEKDDGI
jgi:hypothetical protein